MISNDKNRPGPGNPEEKTILIVDDNDAVWDLLYYIVRKEGFRVEKATDGKEAIDKARMLRPGLIILDLAPQAGFETMRELQADDTVNIPIILLSDRRLDQATLELITQEPNIKGFMQKPVDAQPLTALLHKILMTHPPEKHSACG